MSFKTKNLNEIIKNADILQAQLNSKYITAEMVKKNAVVIDVEWIEMKIINYVEM